jgi:hypothetical protein
MMLRWAAPSCGKRYRRGRPPDTTAACRHLSDGLWENTALDVAALTRSCPRKFRNSLLLGGSEGEMQ